MNRIELIPLGGRADTWFVAFLDTDSPARWWHRFLAPGFRHCLAFGFDGRCWIQVDCLLDLMDVRSFAAAEMKLVLQHLAALDAHVLAIERTLVSRGALRVPLYCVSAVKHLLGVRAWAITPRQLYRALERRGARRIDLV